MIIETRNIKEDGRLYRVTLTETAREGLSAENLASEIVATALEGYEVDSEAAQSIVQSLKENDLI